MDAGMQDDEFQGPADLDDGGAEVPETRSCVVEEGWHGARLDRWLATQVPEFSRSYLQRLIDAGDVSAGGQAVRQASRRIVLGQVYELLLRPPPQASAFRPEAIALSILYEDDDMMVIDKPAGLVMHPAAGNWSGTVLNALLAHHPGAAALPRAGIVHRLDKDTSGLFVVGKTLEATRELSEAIGRREVSRVYLALVHGKVPPESFTIDAPIGRDPVARVRMAVTASGRPSRTDVECLAVAPGGGGFVSGVRCSLHTGRTHQIRVHLAHKGHPLVADTLYGGRPLFGLARQALHARTLALRHPIDGRDLRFDAPLAADLAHAWSLAFGAQPPDRAV